MAVVEVATGGEGAGETELLDLEEGEQDEGVFPGARSTVEGGRGPEGRFGQGDEAVSEEGN